MKNIVYIAVTMYCLTSWQIDAFDLQVLPEPYNQLKELLPFNGHHFYMNGAWIERLFQYNNPKIIVEVGSWLGGSTRHMASMVHKGGLVYGIDTFEGSIELVTDQRFSWMVPTMYDQFLSNVIHAGLTDVIIPLKMTSLQAAEFLKSTIGQADLVYVDAAHDTDSVYKDIVAYFPLVADHKGIMCGDDWMHKPVQTAVLKYAVEHELTVYADENFWFYGEESAFKLVSFLKSDESIWKFPKQKNNK